MPGNGVGDRVHNFFAQENLSQGPRAQVADGNWPLNDNLWVGNQKQFGVSDSSPRNFNPQQSETERGHGSQRVDPHFFNLQQTRPEFAKSQPQPQPHREQSNSNGFMYQQRQNFQTPPNEANFMGVETEYNRNNMNQRGFPFYESQQEHVQEEPPKNPFRPEPSDSHSGFDLFGGQSQHQMNNTNQYPSFMQPLQQQQQQPQQQQFGDIQQLQQQLMLRKMQELQRQELQRQEELQRQQQHQQQQQQNSLNQASLFARQASGSHINGTPNSDWAEVAVNTNWLQRATPQVQGSSGGLAFSPEQSQPQRSMGFVNQQVDQSLYGVPVSRNQFPHQQPQNQSQNQFPGNHFVIPDVQGKGLFGNQAHIQQIKPPQTTIHNLFDSIVEDKSGNSEAALDPDEEKILFGSDDTNIWEAFGTSKNTGGGVSSLIDDNEFGSGLPSSLQSGSWSALMQSAVAETITSGAGAQEEWPDLNFQTIPNSGSVPVSDSTMNQSKQMNVKGMPPGHWTAQQPHKQNWNTNESVVPPVNPRFNINEDEQSDWKRVMNNGIGQGQGQGEGISGININPLVQHRGGVSVNRGGNSNQFSQNNNNQVNYWKNVDSAKSRGSENSDRSQGRVNKVGPQASESSFNSSDKEDLKMENSNDSYRSSSSQFPNAIGQRETFSSDAGTKQRLGNQAGQSQSQKPSGQRKFQYHPMGNLDEDVGVPYGTRQKAVPAPLQHSQGNFGHNKLGGQLAKNPEIGKEIEGVPKGSHDMRFKGMIPGHVTDLFAPHDRSVGLSTPEKASQPSQNMLELLHKVDQSRDRGIARQINSLERNLSSEIPEPENSDGSFGGHQRSQSSNSQGIGLQLGPPSQRLPLPNPNHTPQRTIQTVKPNPMNQTHVSNSRGKGPTNLSPFPPFQETSHTSISGQSQTASETSGHKMVTNFSASLGTDFSRNQFQNQQTVRGQSLTTNHSVNEPGHGHTSQIRKPDETHVRSLNSSLYDNSASTGEKFPVAQARGNSGVSPQVSFPKMLPNTWTNLPTQQLFSANQPRKPQPQSNLATSHPLNILESTSSGQQNVEEQKQSTKESPSVDRGQTGDGPGVNDLPSQNASQRDLEAFGRSLKPNNIYSLPNQMKGVKNTENDPSKRLKDSEMTPNVVAKEAVAIGSDQNGSQSNCLTSVKLEHAHVTPQMAPSWFDQSGTVKSGQIMPAVEQQPIGRVSGSLETHDKELGSAAPDPSQAVVISKPPVVPPSVSVEQLFSPPLQNSVTLRPKKRKYSTRERHPWVKEVSGASKNVQDICSASMEWCGATNRLMEKVEDDGEVIEDVTHVPRPKRRIITTTQLMQQLFPPPPVTILSTDANLNYESVAFYAARLALGDACNLVSCTTSNPTDSHGASDPVSDKNKETNFHKVVEDCMSKSKKLENDFSRLDKRASILDLRVECQDLEKFSIINRFAKFHGRGQTEGEGASSSDAPANAPKPFPQRYVIAVPLPKNLPERVQCLSL